MPALAASVADDDVENRAAARVGVTETEGSLISDTHRRRAIGCVQTGSDTLKTEPGREGCSPVSPNSTEEAADPPDQFAGVL
jgi:hypothetical protein